MKLITGNSNVTLAREVSAFLSSKLAHCTVSRFSDSEVHVQIDESIRGSDVFVIQSTCPPVNDHLMELLIVLDALRRASASRITAVIPYYGYARQDRKAHPRQPISAKLVANLISTAGANRVMTIDFHSDQLQGFFDIQVDNLSAINLLADEFVKRQRGPLVVVAPDVGGTVRARRFAKRVNAPLAIIEKRRLKPNQSEVMNVIGDVKDKHAILVDDMIDTAGTIVQAAGALKNAGAKDVYACASHGVFSGSAFDRLDRSVIKEVIVTDTIPLRGSKKKTRKIRQVGVGQLLAEAIRRTHEDESVSILFH